MSTGFGSLGTKILSAANTVAPIAGAASGWLGPAMAEGRGLEGAPAWMMQRLKGYKIANPIITTEIALNHEATYGLIGAIVSGATGLAVREVGDAVGISPVERMGSALMKFGFSKAVNGVIAAWVWEAVNNPHGAGASHDASTSYIAPRASSTIQADNPQGLVTVYGTGSAPDYR